MKFRPSKISRPNLGNSRLGGVMVSVFAIRAKVRRFKLGRGDDFKGDKNPEHAFLRREAKPHAVGFYDI
jgi:hypothetical protein